MRWLLVVLAVVGCAGCSECSEPARFAPGECVTLKSGGEHGVVAWTDAFHQVIVQWPKKASRVDEMTLMRVPCVAEEAP